MATRPRTLVTFRSSIFNATQPRPNYINPHNYGDDVAEWLRDRLKNSGIPVEARIGQEDFGWYLGFQLAQDRYQFIVGYNADGYWLGWLERARGFLASLLGARNRGIRNEAVEAVHSVLLSSESIHDVRWHYQKDFDALHEELGSRTPT